MNILGKTLMGATAATALAVAAPAQARDNGGIDGEDVLVGALILGGVAAVIAAVSDNDDDDRYERQARYDPRYDRRNTRPNNGYNNGYYRQQNLTPRAAVNQCATAAQRRASQYGRARITEITDIDRDRNGYDVEGRLVVNEGRWNNGGRRWNAGYNNVDNGRFSCRIRYGQVERVRIRGID
ncbi:hypothetical protein [Parasphingopyxis marina]|uniref:17 kDa surface antigen n=1 Tax=Parasphingopyxis marina TaxID=2761622 RepID=A0A842HWX8_9SPHN|nr:hypothetical protein [Parasphingopyxis marina]MBC2776917.1 hypothetical protein [Parasphingopyxis marina]